MPQFITPQIITYATQQQQQNQQPQISQTNETIQQQIHQEPVLLAISPQQIPIQTPQIPPNDTYVQQSPDQFVAFIPQQQQFESFPPQSSQELQMMPFSQGSSIPTPPKRKQRKKKTNPTPPV